MELTMDEAPDIGDDEKEKENHSVKASRMEGMMGGTEIAIYLWRKTRNHAIGSCRELSFEFEMGTKLHYSGTTCDTGKNGTTPVKRESAAKSP